MTVKNLEAYEVVGRDYCTDAGIPSALQRSTYEKIPDTAPYKTKLLKYKDMVKESWSKDAQPVGLYIHGPYGTGKTSIAALLAMDFIKHDDQRKSRWVRFADLLVLFFAARS